MIETFATKYLQPNETSILVGVAGSTAHGLAHELSDEDRLAIHAVSPWSLLGLNSGAATKSRVHVDPDVTSHELAKFANLALKGNPSVLELLWLPEHEHGYPEISEPLIEMRNSFLSEPTVRKSFGGYAHDQAKRLAGRTEKGKKGFSADLGNRTEKHARHCYRLLLSGKAALETGELMVDVSEFRSEIFEIGKLAVEDDFLSQGLKR